MTCEEQYFRVVYQYHKNRAPIWRTALENLLKHDLRPKLRSRIMKVLET